METSKAEQRLEQAMNERRLDLGMRWNEVARRAGVSTETLFRFRKGLRTEDTTHAVERALQWRRGSVDAILTGGKPGIEVETEPAHYDDSKDVAELKQIAASLLEHVEQLRRQIDAIERRRAG